MADLSSNVQITLSARDEATAQVKSLEAALAALKAEQDVLTATIKDATTSANAYIEADTRLSQVAKELTATQAQAATAAKQLSVAQKDYQSAQKEASSAAAEGGTSVGAMGLAFAGATLAVEELVKVTGDIKQYMNEAVKAATDYQSSLIGVQAVGRELGQSTAQVTAAIKTLTSDGLLNAKQAANDLRNVMQRGFSVEEATKAIEAMKDFGSFGKKGQEDLGAAIDSATLGWRHQRSVMMENAGFLHTFQEVWTEYAAAQGKSVSMLTEHEKRQAELNAVMKQGATATGDAAIFAQTYAGQQEVLANKTLDVKAAVGESLMPAVTYLRGAWDAFLVGASVFIQQHGPALQQLFFDVAKVIGTVGAEVMFVASLIGSLFESIASGSMQPMVDAWNTGLKSISDAANTSFDSVKQSGLDAIHTQALAEQQAAAQRSAATIKAAQQISDELGKENQNFKDRMADRNQTFRDSLQKMLESHQDKVATIKVQLADEQAAYNDSVQQRKDNYNEQVAALEDAHANKVADITDRISEERAKGVYIDGILYSQGNKKRLEALQDSMDKENAANAVHVAKLKDKYDDEVKKAQETYDKKASKLQESLTKESGLLQAHATEVSNMQARVAEDDISILERKFAEENNKETRHHVEQLATIQQRSIEKGVSASNGIAMGLAHGAGGVAVQATDIGTKIGQGIADGINKGMTQKASQKGGFLEKLAEGIAAIQGNPQGFSQGLDMWAGSGLQAAWGWLTSQSSHRATGGPVQAGQPYVVGEREPELFVPDTNGTILNSNQMQQLGHSGATVNIHNFHSYNSTDATAFAEQLSWRLS